MTKDEITDRKNEFTAMEQEKTASLISWIRLIIHGNLDYKMCGYASQEEMIFIGCKDFLKGKEKRLVKFEENEDLIYRNNKMAP